MTKPQPEAKQHLLMQYLLSSPELYIRVAPILQAKYWTPALKPVSSYIEKHFTEYRSLPTSEQLAAETGASFELKELTSAETRYAEAELESFCKVKAIEHAIRDSIPMMEDVDEFGKIEKLIRDAITVSISRNLGTDYFENPEARLNQLLTTQALTPTMMRELDEKIGGGLGRQEIIIFAAPSGVGKSITMSNVARNLCLQGLHGVYITLELAEGIVSKRHDSMFTGIPQYEILRNITKTAITLKQVQEAGSGSLLIKRMPESITNANHIRAYVKEYELVHGRLPDFIVVDYLDLCASVEKVSVENQFIKDKYVAEELRSIGREFNCIMITASQLNRGAQNIENMEDLNQSHIAGGLSKINTADNVVFIIQTSQMKARGEMMFKMAKTRNSNGVGSYFLMKFDSISLRLLDMSNGEVDQPGLADHVNKFRQRTHAAQGAPGPTTGLPSINTTQRPPWDDGASSIFQV